MKWIALGLLTFTHYYLLAQQWCTCEVRLLGSDAKELLCVESNMTLIDIDEKSNSYFQTNLCFSNSAVEALQKIDLRWGKLEWQKMMVLKCCNKPEVVLEGANELASVFFIAKPHFWYGADGHLTFNGNCLQNLLLPK